MIDSSVCYMFEVDAPPDPSNSSFFARILSFISELLTKNNHSTYLRKVN